MTWIKRRMARLSTLGRVMIVLTIAVAVALAFTRALAVLIVAVAAACFWLFVLVSTDPAVRYRAGDDPAVSDEDRWRDANL
jgi:hypothetical protein